MISKLLKLSQILEELDNSDEAKLVRDFINQEKSEVPEDVFFSEDQAPNIIGDNNKSKTTEDYPAQAEDVDIMSLKYYRDIAIQAYLDLFYGGARMLRELGSGAFSDTFLCLNKGKSVAIKFSKSKDEYISYLDIKNKRKLLPDELKSILPEIYEAREINKSEVSKVAKRVKDKEGSFFDVSEHFVYKSFIAMELLIETDQKIKDLMYEPYIVDGLIKNEEFFIEELKRILNSWTSEWDWDSYRIKAGNRNVDLIKSLVGENHNLIIIASNICSKIFDMKNSEEELWFNNDYYVDSKSISLDSFGGNFIDTIAKIIVDETINNILSFPDIRNSTSNKEELERIKQSIPILIKQPSRNIRKSLIKIIDNLLLRFPTNPGEKIKDIKIEGFLQKLKALENYGITWGDTHLDNIMLRPTSSSHGYGDLVVADVGLFKVLK